MKCEVENGTKADVDHEFSRNSQINERNYTDKFSYF
jgi:hypothetical protein